MRRLSTKNTLLIKRVLPVVWFGFVGLIMLVGAIAVFSGKPEQAPLVIMPALMAVFGYFIMKHLVFDLMDEVWDAGDSLIVRNKGREERIPLTNVINVSYTAFSNPQRLTLTLREPSAFGKDVTFSPPLRLLPLAKHPLATELIERIDALRQTR